MRECNRCGACCTNESYMGTLQATGKDVQRWIDEGRWDILQYAQIFWETDGNTPLFADLWIKDDIDAKRCPFVRKDRGKPTYRCMIYETRPQVCRDYKAWTKGAVCHGI